MKYCALKILVVAPAVLKVCQAVRTDVDNESSSVAVNENSPDTAAAMKDVYRGGWVAALRSVRNLKTKQKREGLLGLPDDLSFQIEDYLDVRILKYSRATLAARDGQISVLRGLASEGIDLQERDEKGRVALSCAAYFGHVEMIEFLISHLAEFSWFSFITRYNVCRVLNTPDGTCHTALTAAAFGGHVSCLELFHSLGVDLTTPNGNGYTASTCAAFGGCVDVLEFLHLHGVDLTIPNGDNYTAITIAANNGKVNILEFLHSKCVDMTAQDGNGHTAITIAALKGHVNILEFLHSNGVDLTTPDGHGHTALTVAAVKGHVNILEFLHSIGVDLAAPNAVGLANGHGHTALSLATINNNRNVITFLASKGIR